MFDKKTIKIPCSKCGKEISKKISWIKSHNTLTCSCGSVITFEAKEFLSEISRVENAIKSLTDKFR